MRAFLRAVSLSALMLGSNAAFAVDCAITQTGSFGKETVRLVRQQGLSNSARFGIFRAPLAVNTDGAPDSYHPQDPKGGTLALNNIENGIAIRSTADGKRLKGAAYREVFVRWRDSGWGAQSGYQINWKNVIAADGNNHPCVFTSGEYKGYFGSLTALQNGLTTANSGECNHKNQLDQRIIPAIVLRGDANPLIDYGAKVGDLAVVINPQSGKTVAAIVGDSGDGDRIGEGSIALNMAILNRTEQPKTYAQVLGLDTGNKSMIVAVLPGSRLYRRERPYSIDNIAARVDAWVAEQGYGNLAAFAAVAKTCGQDL